MKLNEMKWNEGRRTKKELRKNSERTKKETRVCEVVAESDM
jgi:hypothetical protein